MEGLLHDGLDAGIDGQANLVTLLRFDSLGLPIDDPMGVTLKKLGTWRAAEDIVVGLFDLRFSLHIRLVEIERSRLFLVDLLGKTYITEEMSGQCTVNIVSYGFECHRDTRKIEAILAEPGHGLEIKVLPVDVGNLGVIAEMHLQLAAIIVAGEPQFLEVRDNRLIDDLHDVGLGFESSHAVVESPVLAQGHLVMLFLPGADDIGEIELHLHAGSVLDQRHTPAVTDLATHGREPDSQLGVSLDAGLVVGMLVNLDIPHPRQEKDE